ncbi:hypothetical protein PHMEG_00029336 [Phytophthora megakarya]|uniref:Uncharacterized protein n=1 Tax=Phytophthora megakarya TaxID=4795 RepID=A0A225V3G6_9STRA|nr:hypothetical protein PHMEG_00029336 [Phytophthora megakarya]
MEDMKVSIIVKSQLGPCTICTLKRPHKIRYQLLLCSSGTCKVATPYDACPWTNKVLTCQEKAARIHRGMARRFGLADVCDVVLSCDGQGPRETQRISELSIRAGSGRYLRPSL